MGTLHDQSSYEQLKMLVPIDPFEEYEEFILEPPVPESLIPFEEGSVTDNRDMKVHFDLEFGQTSALKPVEKFIIFIEWENEDLMFYLGREAYRTISGMTTVTLTNRKTGEKTIGQSASTIGYNQFIRPLKFEKIMYLFTHKILVEFEFERDDEIMQRRWITTMFNDGMLQMEEEQLTAMRAGPIDPIERKCRSQLNENVFDYRELAKIRKLCRDGYTGSMIAALHKLSDKYDVKIMTESQDALLMAPLTILEFLIVAEVYGLDIVKKKTLAKLKRQSEIKVLSAYAKYLGPKVIRDLLKLFKVLSSTGSPLLSSSEIVPAEETEIMKTVLVSWSPKSSITLPDLQESVNETWTKSQLFFTFEISSTDSFVVLKQEEQTNKPKRPPTVAACKATHSPKYFGDSNVLRKSEFDVHIEREESIRFFIEYGEKRESTLWHIKTLITLCVKRADNTKLWEYTTDHTFSWNSLTCIVNAMSEVNLKKNYDGKIQFQVVVTIVESEGFVKVDSCFEPSVSGTTHFSTPDKMQTSASNKIICQNSTVLKSFIESPYSYNSHNHKRIVFLEGVSGRSLELLLKHCTSLQDIDLCDPQNQEIPILARVLQHKSAIEAISERMRKYEPTERLRISEIFGYDDVQAWCCSKIQSFNDFSNINCEVLEERSIAAVFASLKNF